MEKELRSLERPITFDEVREAIRSGEIERWVGEFKAHRIEPLMRMRDGLGHTLTDYAAMRGHLEALMRLGVLSVEMLDEKNPETTATPRYYSMLGGHRAQFDKVASVLDRVGYSWSDAEFPAGVVDYHAATGELIDRVPLVDGTGGELADGAYTYLSLFEETHGREEGMKLCDYAELARTAVADGPGSRVDGGMGYAVFWPSFSYVVDSVAGRFVDQKRAAVAGGVSCRR